MDHNTVYGVDVSKRNLVTAGYDAQTPVVVHNRPESIAAWLAGLPRGAAVAMEATGAYHQVLAHLAHAAGLRVYVLNPRRSNTMRGRLVSAGRPTSAMRA